MRPQPGSGGDAYDIRSTWPSAIPYETSQRLPPLNPTALPQTPGQPQPKASHLPLEPNIVVQPTPRQQREHTGLTITDWFATVEENGRTYQGYRPEAYALPNDGEEQERLDLQHTMFLILLDDNLAQAPIRDPEYVLDIGTGTGIWALQFATENPKSQVIGTDLSLIQPTPKMSNCQFYLEDSEHSEWVFSRPFDYIHIRSMGPSFDDFMTVIKKSYANMKPDGYIELVDGSFELESPDGTLQGTFLDRWARLVIIGGGKLGRDFIKSKYYRDYLTHVGFVDVKERRLPLPLSPWPSEEKFARLGRYMLQAMTWALNSYSKILASAGLSESEVNEINDGVRRDLENPHIHAYFPLYIVYGRKPHSWELPSSRYRLATPEPPGP